jgi:hypothetical protein
MRADLTGSTSQSLGRASDGTGFECRSGLCIRELTLRTDSVIGALRSHQGRAPSVAISLSTNRCSRVVRKSSGYRKLEARARFVNPRSALADRGSQPVSSKYERSGDPTLRGRSDTSIRHLRPFSPKAAIGQGASRPSSNDSARTLPGVVSLPPSHSPTGTETALPTNRQRARRKPASSAGFVQPAGRPCSRSAVSMVGRTTRPSGKRIAGGEAIPMADPALRGGTAPRVKPLPEAPSVQ